MTAPTPEPSAPAAAEPDDLEAFRDDLVRHVAAGRALLRSGVLKQEPRPYSPELADFHRSRERLRLELADLGPAIARELAYTALPPDIALRAIGACLDADLYGSSLRLYGDLADLAVSYIDEAVRWRRRRVRLTDALERRGITAWVARVFGGRGSAT